MTRRSRDWPHDLRERYEHNGYVIVRGVLDAELVAEVRSHVDWLMAHNPDLRPEKLQQDLVADDPFWLRLVSDDRLLDVAEQFIGPNIALFASHYIAKPPGDGHPVVFHQDGSYWPLEPMEVVTICLWADDADPENGCLRVIPGTHRMELHEMTRVPEVPSVLSTGIDKDLYDESKAVDFVVQTGDVTVHHPHIVHGSNSNRSDRWRRGLNIRYIPTTTRITRTPWFCPFLLRGEAVPGVNDYLPFPEYVEDRHMPFRGCEAWKGGRKNRTETA